MILNYIKTITDAQVGFYNKLIDSTEAFLLLIEFLLIFSFYFYPSQIRINRIVYVVYHGRIINRDWP